jgi:aspartate/tyrosine/aromatic aminotransferase
MRLFVSHEMEIYVVQSYSKKLGFCTKWIGSINVVLSSLDVLTRVKRQLKMIVRPMYSNPLIHRV